MPDPYHNSSRRRLLRGAAATWLLSISRTALAASPQILAVRIWPAASYTRITLESRLPLRYRHFTLGGPDRLVVDIEGAQLNSVLAGAGRLVREQDPYIRAVRAGQFDKHTVRLVLELKQPVAVHFLDLPPVAGFRHRLVTDLYPKAGSRSALQDDPLLALLEDYNQGELARSLP